MARKTFRSLLYVTPRYLIALSATSYRSDGLDALFPIFFGKEKIIRELIENIVFTGLIHHLNHKLNRNYGKMDWNALLEDQASNENRNKLIVTSC